MEQIFILSLVSCTLKNHDQLIFPAREFTISIPELWKQLPDDIKSIDNLTTFKVASSLIQAHLDVTKFSS